MLRIVSTALVAIAVAAIPAGATAGSTQRVGPVTEVSRGCPGQNAEAEQAVDGRFLYVVWIGCGGIGFARSVNDGRTFSKPFLVPGSAGHGFHVSGIGSGLPKYGWDPSIAVAPDHAVYVAYMLYRGTHVFPVVATSHDHGATFGHLSRLPVPGQNNWATVTSSPSAVPARCT